MNTEILGSVLQIVALVVLSYPLGRYIAKVYKGERTWLDFMAPVEKWMYKICGIDPNEEMGWKKFLFALLTVNVFWFFWGMVLLVCQGWLPLNPDGNAGQSPDLAFNTCISFMVNCIQFTIKLIQVLKAKSGDCPALPSGFNGNQPWHTNNTIPQKNQNTFTVRRAKRNFFQPISSFGSIPQILYIHFSTGAIKSNHVRSPLYTFAM